MSRQGRLMCLSLVLSLGPNLPATAQEAKAAPAVERPDPAAVRAVWNFYYRGQGGAPLLVELVPCLQVDDKAKSPTRFECLQRVEGPVKAGTKVSAWTSWLVPENDTPADLVVQYVYQGVVRSTRDINISGKGWRQRTYATETPSKPGTWEIRVLQGSEELGRAQFEVR